MGYRSSAFATCFMIPLTDMYTCMSRPDHGYPVRLVVPGQIGGRSVKWLKKIEVSEQESQHHLHFWVRSSVFGALTRRRNKTPHQLKLRIINYCRLRSCQKRPERSAIGKRLSRTTNLMLLTLFVGGTTQNTSLMI